MLRSVGILNGQIFEEASAPEEPHPNCKCTLIPVDANGNKTGNPRKPRKPNPKPKPKCSRISSPYGMRKNPFNPKEDKMHNGTDFSVPTGTPIPSPVDGQVTKNDSNELNGNRLQVTDKNGVQHNFYIYNPNLISLQVHP